MAYTEKPEIRVGAILIVIKMKKKNLKTLALAKKTIAQLAVKNQQKIVGGVGTFLCNEPSWRRTSCQQH